MKQENVSQMGTCCHKISLIGQEKDAEMFSSTQVQNSDKISS